MSDPRVDEMLARIWERMRPVVEERLALIDAAALPDAGAELRAEAAEAAHKLAGSLGSYGYAEGSRLAARVEAALRGEARVAGENAAGEDVAAVAAALRRELTAEG